MSETSASPWAPTPIATGTGHQHIGRRPQGLVVGPFAFFSAIRGSNPDTGVIPEDPETQIEQAFSNLEAVLVGMGWELGNVARVGMFFKDLQAHRPIVDAVWGRRFPDVKPARFGVQVQEFGGPGDASLLLLDVIAVRPTGGAA